MKATKIQRWILNYLRGREWTSPTIIGMAYGRYQYGDNAPSGYHSAWASPKCSALVDLGELKRNGKGHYKLK